MHNSNFFLSFGAVYSNLETRKHRYQKGSRMKKFFWAALAAVLLTRAQSARAVAYGDLYDIQWCPCNIEEAYNANGSVVLGKTVMCPCDSLYNGYKRTLEKDVRKVQDAAQKTIKTASHFKYYIGVDFNKSHLENTKQPVNFDNLPFAPTTGFDVPADTMINSNNNIGIVIGTRPGPNFGIEAFYNRTYKKNTTTQYDNQILGSTEYHVIGTYVSSYQAFGVDLIGYLPVTDYFDFLAFVGLGQYMFDNSADFEVRHLEGTEVVDRFDSNFDERKLAWRVGGGFQFNIARGIVLRSMYRFIKVKTDTIRNMQEWSVGVRFLF